MSETTRASYLIMAVLLVLIGGLNLGILLLTSLFGYFALRFFSFRNRKVFGLVIYLVGVATIGVGLVYFSRQIYVTLPQIAESTIPAVVGFAEKNKIELPFSDYASLKTVALDEAREGLAGIGRYARAATFQLVLLVTGLVVAASLHLSPPWGTEIDPQTSRNSLYARVVRELAARFKTFFQSFSIVIGAQILISIINTGLTAVFLLWNGYPFALVLVVLTFLAGLVPIVGNLISNTLIVGVGFTLSPRTAFEALIFLIVIHKLEYFLNSKIIGDRIKTPMWLTLIGLVLGEKLMGIPGMILAPVVLHYVKTEASKSELEGATAEPPKPVTIQS